MAQRIMPPLAMLALHITVPVCILAALLLIELASTLMKAMNVLGSLPLM